MKKKSNMIDDAIRSFEKVIKESGYLLTPDCPIEDAEEFLLKTRGVLERTNVGIINENTSNWDRMWLIYAHTVVFEALKFIGKTDPKTNDFMVEQIKNKTIPKYMEDKVKENTKENLLLNEQYEALNKLKNNL